MLSNELIEDLISSAPGGRYTEDAIRRDRFPYGSHVASLQEATRSLTDSWVPRWQSIVGASFQTEALLLHPIYVLPSPSFSVEAILDDGKPCVLIHYGTMELISFAIECDLLTGQVMDQIGLNEISNSPSAKQILLRIDALSHFLFRSHMKQPERLPKLTQWLTGKSRACWDGLVVGAEAFMLLHELAHIELGHLRESEPLSREALAERWQQREFEADAYALTLVQKAPELLVYGAHFFLWWFSFYQAWDITYSNFYPTAIARLEALGARVGLDSTERFKTDIHSMKRVAQVLGDGGRREDMHGKNGGKLPGTAEDARNELQLIYSVLLS